MKRRVLAMAMALAMTFTSLPVNSLTAVAASEFTDGQDGMAPSEDPFSSLPDGEPEDPAGVENGEAPEESVSPGSDTFPEADALPEEILLEQPLEDVTAGEREGIQNVDGEEAPSGDIVVPGEEGEAEEPLAPEADPVPQDPVVPEEEIPSQEEDSPYPALTEGAEVTVRITEEEPVRWYRFTPEISGVYTLTSSGSYDTLASVYEDPEGEALRENDDASDSNSNFALSYALEAGKTYYYAVQMCYEFMKGSFDICVDYTRRAVKEAKIASYPQRVYYRELNTPNNTTRVSYFGLSLDVAYTDGTVENVSYTYGSSGLRVTDNVQTETLGTGERVYVPGTYTATVTYGECVLEYEIQIKTFEEMPELILDETVTSAAPELYEYYKINVAEAGEYEVQTMLDLTGGSNSDDTVELRDENGVIASVVNDSSSSSHDGGYSGIRLRVYSLEAGKTYYVRRYWSYRVGYGSSVQSSVRASKIAPMTEGEELTGTEPGYYVRSFVPDVSGVYQVKQTGQGYTGWSFGVTDLSGNTASLSDGYYSDGDGWYKEAYLVQSQSYLIYYPYLGNEAASTVSIQLKADDAHILAEGGEFSLTGTGQRQVVYVKPEQPGLYCLELEMETGSEEEWGYFYLSGGYSYFYESGFKNDGKTYYRVVRMTGQVCRAKIDAFSIPKGESGTIRLTRLPSVTGFEISQYPRTEYGEGERFYEDSGLEELTAQATYEDGSQEELSWGQVSEKTGLSLRRDSGAEYLGVNLKPGSYTFQIGYLDQSASFRIKVSGTEGEEMPSLTAGMPVSGKAEETGLLKYRFVPETSGFYQVRSTMSMKVLDGAWEEVGRSVSIGSGVSEEAYPYQTDLWLEAGATYYLYGDVFLDRDYGVAVDAVPVLTLEEDFDVEIPYSGGARWYAFTPETPGIHTVYSYDLTGDAYVELYDAAGNRIAYNDDGGDGLNFCLEHSLGAGKTYYYKFRMYGGGTGSYKVHFQGDTRNATEMEMGRTYEVDAAGSEAWYRFTPEASGMYTVTSEGGPYEYAYLYKDSLTSYVTSDYNGAGNGNFRLSYWMKAGETFYYRFGTNAEASYRVRLQDTTVKDLSVGTIYELALANPGDEVWYRFTPETDGRFVIYSTSSGSNVYPEIYLYAEDQSSYMDYDANGGNGGSFLLGCDLTANKTYYFRTRSRYNHTGTYDVHFEAAPETQSVAVAASPSRIYCENMETSVDYTGLAMAITYQDGTTESLSYGRKSPRTGRTITVTEPEGMWEDDRLKAGTHALQAIYDGKEAEFSVVVKGADEMRSFTGSLSGAAADFQNDSMKFSVESDGYYILRTKYSSVTLEAKVYDTEGNRKYPYKSDYSYYGDDRHTYEVLRLQAEETYLLVLEGTPGAEGDYEVVLEAADPLSLTAVDEGIWGTYGKLYSLEITESGYYSLSSDLDVTSGYLDLDCFKENGSGCSYIDYRSGNGHYQKYFYLREGKYFVLSKGNSFGVGYTLSASRIAAPLPLDTEETGTLSESFTLFTFTPSQSGNYTFSSTVTGANAYYGSAQISVYEKGSSIGYGTGSSGYDGELGAYQASYSMGAALTAGEEYLVRLSSSSSSYAGAEYTLRVSLTREVASLELVNAPKQVYYYKLDLLTRDTDLGSGTSVKVTYTDGTEETLSSYGTSAVSGQRYTLRLPETAKYSASGYVLAGTWNAQLTYLNKTISVPIKVKTIGVMPSVEFNESGQGSYSGISEGEDGSGYVRFVAPEDGFYNLTLGAESGSGIRYSGILNGAYDSYRYTTEDVSSESRALVNTSVYVREGQPCYVKYQRSEVGEVALSVERASDKVITELIPGKEETVSIEKGGDAKWFSFTPTSSGRYHLNSLDAGRSIRAELYLSPDDSNYQASADSYYYSSYNNTNGYDLRLSYDLTAGKTYYYKTAYSYDSYTGTYRMVLVKESRAKSLELLTEGQIYCSSLPGFVANSFANLEFQITYEDDTTETMTFGYKGGTQRNYSLQGRRISYDAPSFSNDDGTPIEDGMYTVNFHYDGVSCQVDDVLVCAVSGLDSAQGTFQAEIGAGAYKYYRYAPEESGYYRVMASGRTSYPSVVMFDKYMQEIAPLYTNSYLKNGAYSRVCVYNLGGITETGDGYCLRLGNSSSAAMSVGCTLEKMSQATDLQVSSYPQLDYYLGVDSSFAPDGLALLVTYGDGTTETLSYGDNSTVTGLSLEVQVGDSVDGSLYLGSSGSKIVLVRYMDQTASLEINVKDPADVGEMTDTAAVSGEIATVRDYAYVKYTAAKSGFYDFMLTGEGTVPYISYIRNASYTELESFDYYSGGARYDSSLTALGNRSTRHYLVYLLEGKTYYMKGYLTENGQRTSGSYEASVAPLEDLRDASCGGTLDGGKTAVYQLTAWADGYYQFTLQGVNNGAVRIYNSSFNAIKATYGEEDGRKYAAARLRAGNAYFVACVNQGSGETAYSVQADKRPEVTSISIAQEPEKPVYYAQFENSVNPGGLVVAIHYADGTQEELAYGESSQWGLSLSLDTTTIQKDENGNFETGTQTVGVIYLDKRASFTIEVQDFDIASALAMEAEKWEDVDLSAGASAFYVFTPEKDVEYRYYSHGDAAVVGYIYDSGYDLLTSGTGGGDKDFSLSCELKKGESYILRVRGLSAKAPISTKVRVHDTTAWIEVTSLSLAQDEMILGSIGETQALTAIVKPDNADYKDQISWTSADSQIVSVDEKGVVTAQKEGETTVTATAEDGGYQASCTVYVDLKDPQLTEVYPADKTVMGPSASTMWIYAQDNVGVEKVTVEYKKSTEAEYTLSVDSDKDEGNGQSSVNKAQLPVGDDYFQDGDEINVRVTACDKGGRKSQPQERTYVIDKKAPSVTNASAVHDTDLRAVKVTWKGNQEEDISGYAIYRKVKDASEDTYQYLGTCQGYVNQADYSYVDDKVENKDQVYTYKIAASDQRGNTAEFVLENTEVTRINEEPVIRLNCQSTMISGEAYAFDLSGSTDDGSIVSWSVDYGDDWADEGQTGQTSYTHTYTLPEGTADAAYTVKVTATDDEGAKATLEKSVRVVDLANASMVTVTVVDKRGLTLENAPVYVNMGEDTQEKLTTDGKGKVEYIALPGFTTVGSYMEGYLPVKRTIQAEAGKKAEVTLVLEKKDLVEARFESHRMTLDEIRDAGIDVSDPANHHVVEYQVTLMYSTVKFRYNGKGVCDIEGSGDYHYIPYVLDDEVIVILEIPVKASILKEFYGVNMYIINNASEDFSLLDNHVKLNVPDGLTVMEGEGAAAVETDIPEIKGQSTELVTWILRGDKEGEYDLTADYRGVLSDFNEPVSATFKSDKKITVYGVSNMEITLQIPESFTDGEFYYNLVMRNKGAGNDADMYLPQLSGAGDLIQTKYTKEDGTGVCVDEMPEVLRAGESITKNYLITDQIYEQLHEKYPDYESFVFYFKNMWIEEVSSYGIPLIVEFLTWEDMKATYDSYRAQVPEVTKLEAVGAVYGYKEGDAYLEVEGKAADGAEYDLSYEWYDTSYDTQDAQPIGEGSRFVVPAGLDAGEYHYHCVVIATRKDNKNKAQTQYQDVVLTIAPKPVTLVWSGNETRTYNGEPSNVTAAVVETGLLGEDTCTVTVTGGTEVYAGTHTATAASLSNENYALPEENTCQYVIEPKVVTLIWSGNETRTYDGEPSNVTAAVNQEDLIGEDTCTVEVDGGTEVYAGTHTATAASLSNENYALPEENTCQYVIDPKVVTLIWSGNETRTYDGEPSNVTAAVNQEDLIG
ncbi:MAG: Ig-like domain-containing protein, partial [Eubacteriales bacterium]|nr:Ig-like domain-containing protein [Eubacteriales bacterium]